MEVATFVLSTSPDSWTNCLSVTFLYLLVHWDCRANPHLDNWRNRRIQELQFNYVYLEKKSLGHKLNMVIPRISRGWIFTMVNEKCFIATISGYEKKLTWILRPEISHGFYRDEPRKIILWFREKEGETNKTFKIGHNFLDDSPVLQEKKKLHSCIFPADGNSQSASSLHLPLSYRGMRRLWNTPQVTACNIYLL